MSPANSFDRDIEFIYELGALRFMPRSWHRFLGPQFANNSEHMFRVAWIALIIARREGGVDLQKVLLMALVHDIAESRVGDVDYLSRQYVDRHEDQAIEDMLGGTTLAPDLVELCQEYERRDSLEAKIVKDADNLDVDFELAEQAASGHAALRDSKAKMRAHVAATKLTSDTAKQIWQQLQQSDPHAWHRNARNRFTAGEWSDWKKPQSDDAKK